MLQTSIFEFLFRRRLFRRGISSSEFPTVSKKPSNRKKPVVLVCPHADIVKLWNQIAHSYFPERKDLLAYAVCWSRRNQRRVLASCNIRSKKITVARELQAPEHAEHLEPLLYHEMCHAVLGDKVPVSGRRRLWHGRAFRELEKQHPGIHKLDGWIASGGWRSAVRSHRAKAAASRRKRMLSL